MGPIGQSGTSNRSPRYPLRSIGPGILGPLYIRGYVKHSRRTASFSLLDHTTDLTAVGTTNQTSMKDIEETVRFPTTRQALACHKVSCYSYKKPLPPIRSIEEIEETVRFLINRQALACLEAS